MTDAERVFLDTCVLLTATDPDRPGHAAALRALNTWPARGVTLFVSGQVLREYLSVATRSPKGNGLGLSPAEAVGNVRALLTRLHLLEESERCRERLLALIGEHGVSGKQVHDANIVATMLGHGVTRLITFNEEDFRRFAVELMTLEEPAPR